MSNTDRSLIIFFTIVAAVSAYGSFRQREGIEGLTKANVLLIEAIGEACGVRPI